MKKFFLALISIILLFPIVLPAQKTHSNLKNEIGITGGPVSLTGGILFGSVGLFNAIGSSISHSSMDLDRYGQYGLHYYYQMKPWCQIGVKVSVEGAKLTRYTDTLKLVVKDRERMALISLMPSVRFTYLNCPWVRLYSGLDMGCCYWLNEQNSKSTETRDNKDSNFMFAFNATIFGVNVGKKFFGMVEFNLGYDSYIKAGIGARF